MPAYPARSRIPQEERRPPVHPTGVFMHFAGPQPITTSWSLALRSPRYTQLMMEAEAVAWRPAEDAIDPARVPQRRLESGARMPAIGLGTFGSDHVSPAEIAAAVRDAAVVGYRHFDCASVYGNEDASDRRCEKCARASGAKNCG